VRAFFPDRQTDGLGVDLTRPTVPGGRPAGRQAGRPFVVVHVQLGVTYPKLPTYSPTRLAGLLD